MLSDFTSIPLYREPMQEHKKPFTALSKCSLSEFSDTYSLIQSPIYPFYSHNFKRYTEKSGREVSIVSIAVVICKCR